MSGEASGYIGRDAHGVFEEVIVDNGDPHTLTEVAKLHAAGLAVERVPLRWAVANLGTDARYVVVNPDGRVVAGADGRPGAVAPSPLDAAIAASSALDPLGARKPAEQLRVPSWEEKEAERRRVAERIASMGRGA